MNRNKYRKTTKKRSKRAAKRRLIIVSAVLLLAIVLAVITFFNLPSAKVNRAIAAGDKYTKEEDYQAAISYIGYLAAMRKKKRAEDSLKILSDIQSMFKDDKGWASEQDMLEDMAQFRRERMGL